jgi:hypothetical protein
MPPALNPGAPAGADDLLADDDDWFGEGSAFDSGEELANALMALAGGGTAPTAAAVRARTDWNEDDAGGGEAFEPLIRSRAGDSTTGGHAAAEFQVASMPSRRGSSLRDPQTAPGRWSAPGTNDRAQRTGWAIRQSVQILKTTEDIIRRIREEAVDVSWRAAFTAMSEGNVVPPRRIRRDQKRAAAAQR